MTTLSKDQLRTIRAAIDTALVPLREKLGLERLRLGNCKYGAGGDFEFKLEGIVKGGKTAEAQRYEMHREFMPELPPLGEPFKYGPHTYTATGMNTTGTKVIAQSSTNPAKPGRWWLLPTEKVRAAVAKTKGIDLRAPRAFADVEVPPPPRT